MYPLQISTKDMKIKHTFLAVVFASTGFVQAGDRSIGDGTLPEFLEQFDTNDDGMIDEEERQAIRDLRAKMREERRNSIDTDGDGTISRGEIEDVREAMREKIEERRHEKFNEIAGEDALISREEFATIPGVERLREMIQDAIFGRLDADDDNAISEEEFMQRLRRHNSGNPTRPPTGEENEGDE